MRKLSVVATPIGNLEDITPRALRTLSEADIVVCEDTRVTKKLLMHFGIQTPSISFHGNSGEKGIRRVIELLAEGKHVALVSDAGTPGVSDPGLELVSRVRDEFRDEVAIEAIPGPSALAAALSVAGLRAATFTFYGFLPQKKGREKLFNEIAAGKRASVFYESPHRLLKALESLVKVLPEHRRIGVFRELTKLHEESVVGSPSEVLAHFKARPDTVRGECVVVVEEAN